MNPVNENGFFFLQISQKYVHRFQWTISQHWLNNGLVQNRRQAIICTKDDLFWTHNCHYSASMSWQWRSGIRERVDTSIAFITYPCLTDVLAVISGDRINVGRSGISPENVRISMVDISQFLMDSCDVFSFIFHYCITGYFASPLYIQSV